jgi:hypothetical protein
MPFVFKNISQQHSGSVLDSPISTAYKNIFTLLRLDTNTEWKYAYKQFAHAFENSNMSKELSKEFLKLSKLIAKKIASMPMKHTGNNHYDFFKPNRKNYGDIKLSINEIYDSSFLMHKFDYFAITEQHYNIFRYLGQNLYGTSTIMSKWKEKTIALNKDNTPIKDIIDSLSSDVLEERDTTSIRKILNDEKECVWSGKELRGNTYDVDHVLPYSVWFNNDLWNMLPTDRKLNQNLKKAMIPTAKLIEYRAETIKHYWNQYMQEWPSLFINQMKVSLTGSNNNFDNAIEALCKKSHYLINDRGHQGFQYNF